MEMVLACCGQGGQGSAVEAVFESQNGVAVLTLLLGRVLSCHLDGALVGLSAGVSEKHLVHAGLFAQKLGKPGAGLGIIQVGGMLQGRCLLGNCLYPYIVAQAEAGNADAAAHVDVFPAVSAVVDAALAGDDLNGKTAVSTGHILLVQRNDAVHS